MSGRHAAAERDMRELLADAGLPEPDEVSYDEASVVFLWHDRKLAVVVDLDLDAAGGDDAEGAEAGMEGAGAGRDAGDGASRARAHQDAAAGGAVVRPP
jgi:hypothetical protein